MSNDRGEKFRHRDQKPHHPTINYQKSDPASGKKKKRKTYFTSRIPFGLKSTPHGDVDLGGCCGYQRPAWP